MPAPQALAPGQAQGQVEAAAAAAGALAVAGVQPPLQLHVQANVTSAASLTLYHNLKQLLEKAPGNHFLLVC